MSSEKDRSYQQFWDCLSICPSVYFLSFALAHEFLCIYHLVFILPYLGFSFIFLSSFSNTASMASIC